MSAAEGQLQWTSRRNFLKSRVDSVLFNHIPEQYSPGVVLRLMPVLLEIYKPQRASSFPEEQRELVRKTMSPATHQLPWDSRRRFLQDRVDPSLFDRIPEQYSPEAMNELEAWLDGKIPTADDERYYA